jgi:hypothetical protein
MRFAYIDSQGNEVPIPSVDALALRIELGAVGPDTQLYDAQADHWGPARTHEIFHTLSRDSGEEGFMAPPPMAQAPPAAAAASRPVEPTPPSEEEEEEEEAGSGEFDLGLTLADPPPEAPPETKRDREDDRTLGEDIASQAAESQELPLLSEPESQELPLLSEPESQELPLLSEPEPPEVAEPEPLEAAEPEPQEEDSGFDFGDLGGGLELEASPAESQDTGLETEMEFGAPPSSFDPGGDDLMLETPMSAFEPESPPGWMEDEGSEDVMDFSAVADEEEVQDAVSPVAEASPRQRRVPKDRPSPPKFKRQRSMSGPIVFVVLLVALGVGGYYGWPFLSRYLESRNAPERPPVVLPTIPEELMPRMRQIAGAAIADVVSEVDQATRVADAPTEPDDDWLAGVYLGNASQYPGVGTFWEGMDAFMAGLHGAEWQSYHDALAIRVGNEGLDAQAVAQITERADSGFVAAEPRRLAALAEMERLVDSSLDLHDFLLENEADIEFRPGVTSAADPNVDPVLEISAPAGDRERINQLFDGITDALDALGSLDRVTRDRLVAAITARLQQVGVE